MKTLSAKYSFFTIVLVLWVVLVLTLLDPHQDGLKPSRLLVSGLVVVVISGVISRFSLRILSRPLDYLQSGIDAVRNGRLERVRISRTGDEIQSLGETFNLMIDSLAASKAEIREHQELLEERIRQRTEELERATREAQEGNRAKSEFLANMSHELRTPLNGVLGMMDMVLEDGQGLRADQRERLQTAKDCALSLLSLLGDLLDTTNAETQRLVLEPSPFWLSQLLEALVPRHRQAAAEKGLPFDVQIEPGAAGRRLIGDGARIRQILDKLLSNAVKFTDRGHVLVRVSAGEVEDDRLMLHFDIEDTGPGIQPDLIPIIFEPFTQIDSSLRRLHGGSGLGLALARKLAELHGGSVLVTSTPGAGSTFHLEIRCGIHPQQQSPVAGEPGAAASSRSRRRLLVVEDNAVNQKVSAAVLTKAGFEVVLAGDGYEALEQLEKQDFEAVIMDVQMPRLDGLEATRRIRRNPKWWRLPVLAMTAHSFDCDRHQCLAAGMDDFVTKPVVASVLVSRIESLLASRDLNGLAEGVELNR